jgi:hypothetical protein
MAKVLAGQVPPGAYYTDAISPSITLTLEDRWSVFGFDFGVPGSRLSDVIFLEPVDRADWGIVLMSPTRVFDPRKEWEENFNIVPFPQDFAAWLDDHPYLDARSPEPVTLGGVEGTRIDTVVGSPPSDNPFPSCGGAVCPRPTVLGEARDRTDDAVQSGGRSPFRTVGPLDPARRRRQAGSVRRLWKLSRSFR